MRIAVLADIHGNHAALEACLAHAEQQGAEAYWFLGDYVGELPCPERTMACLYAWAETHDCTFIRGNKENYWLGALDTSLWQRGSSTTGVLWYMNQRITVRDRAFFAGLPIARVMEIPGLPAVTICHGSPRAVGECLVPPGDTAQDSMEAAATPLILCGHRHRQAWFEHAGRRAVNPGSVGVSLESGGKAEYMLLEGVDGAWQETMVRLDYDVEQIIREMREEDLFSIAPCWMRVTVGVLRGMNVSQAAALRRTMALCEQGEGVCEWPDIPEKYWEMTCRELGV